MNGYAQGFRSSDQFTFNAIANSSNVSVLSFVTETTYNYSIYSDGVFAMAPSNPVLSNSNIPNLFSMTFNYLWIGEYSYDQIKISL